MISAGNYKPRLLCLPANQSIYHTIPCAPPTIYWPGYVCVCDETGGGGYMPRHFIETAGTEGCRICERNLYKIQRGGLWMPFSPVVHHCGYMPSESPTHVLSMCYRNPSGIFSKFCRRITEEFPYITQNYPGSSESGDCVRGLLKILGDSPTRLCYNPLKR